MEMSEAAARHAEVIMFHVLGKIGMKFKRLYPYTHALRRARFDDFNITIPISEIKDCYSLTSSYSAIYVT